jgi:hypothetical protein
MMRESRIGWGLVATVLAAAASFAPMARAQEGKADAEGGRSKGCGMRHCLVYGAYGCGIWTMSPGDDFEFHHNVIADSLSSWITEGRGKREYRVTDSLFAGNKHLAGTGAGPLLNFKDTDPGFLKLPGSTMTDRRVDIERDQTKRGYLHLVPGTLGADLGAGLFTKKAGE